jgi:hypothetical protein
VTEVRIALLVLGEEDDPIDAGNAQFRRARDSEHGTDDRLDALTAGRLGEGHRRVQAVTVRQPNRREAELCRPLGDHLGLHCPFEHREGGKNAKRYVGLSHTETMGRRACRWKILRGLIPSLARLPVAPHDVANLAHTALIRLRDAVVARALIAIAQESVAGPGEHSALLGVCTRHGTVELARHAAIESGEAGIVADRDFP